jgi:predicted lysophospholipase L1 biosynthesis ABC-type transport system permease subunit
MRAALYLRRGTGRRTWRTVLALAVRRRRRELALLKTLGMTRRQVRAIVAWQTTVTLVIAAGAGLPLGLALGRWAWQAFAGSLGVAPVTAVPARWRCWPARWLCWPPGTC